MTTLSIVIVSWNTKDILDDCLESVYRETDGIEFEVIVVDNDSQDGSAEMVKEKYPGVILIVNEKNVGFAAANNIGFNYCNGKYILLLNSDTVVLDGALQKTVSYADQHPDLGVLSCKILNDDHTLQPNCSMYPSLLNSVLFITGLYKAFPRSKFFGRAQMTWWDYDDERQVQVLKGCFMLVRKEALDATGPMDERFFMYSEEVDWCFRFSKAGWKLGYFPDASIIHLGGVSAAKLGGSRALVKDKSTRRYMKKHWSKPAYAVGLTFMFTFYLSRLPGALLLALLSGGSSKYKKRLENHWTGLRGLATKQDI
ncbi:glycosyltransferase family 2 protein [Ketobacter sp.]|uniref:glycosyltransferase family 2 protein n=1 Tax=Ketobacter sp. TaxID=2083498 RepID=UPI000F1232AC|nr:glycosyltransferase family 2 protein [Ketobacter sp.]RLT93662.1 MAG: glycosyltransferase family 2 protein [Ketobacter sp.]